MDNQTWQTEWKTAPLAKVQLCEYENQTLEDFVAVSRSFVLGPPEFFTFKLLRMIMKLDYYKYIITFER